MSARKFLLVPHELGLTDIVIRAGLFDSNLATSIAESVPETHTVLVCFRLNPLRTAFEALGLPSRSGQRRRLADLSQELSERGIRSLATVALLPGTSAPRYFFPIDDPDSHRFLVQNILFPRRYALSLLPRIAMRIYASAVSFAPLANILARQVALIVVREDD